MQRLCNIQGLKCSSHVTLKTLHRFLNQVTLQYSLIVRPDGDNKIRAMSSYDFLQPYPQVLVGPFRFGSL